MNKLLLVAFMSMAFSQLALGMDFSWSMSGNVKIMVEMKGEVRKGDFEKFQKFMLDNLSDYTSGTRMVTLSSNGGDLVETLKIAKILRAMYATILLKTDEPCASSCFFLYINGISRATHGKLGIHRAYFDASYFSGLPLKDAEIAHAELTKTVKMVLEANSVPEYLIEKMNRTSSSEIYWLNDKEIDDLGERPAWYEEFLIAKCGYDKEVGNKYNENPQNPALEKAWLENYIKYQPCEEKFLAIELKSLAKFLEPIVPAVKAPVKRSSRH